MPGSNTDFTSSSGSVQNSVLMRIFGLEKGDSLEDWRKWPNKELHNLYSSPNDIRMIKSRRWDV
jgi:hypothetical protein